MADTSIKFSELSHGSYFKATHPDSVIEVWVKRGDFPDEAYRIGAYGLALEDESYEFAPDTIVQYLDQGDWPDCTDHYREEIKKWNWDLIKKEMAQNISYNKYEDSEPLMNAWIGSTIGIMPSGKVYTFWTSNQTDEDVNRDQCFNDALEEIAEEQGVYVDWRDGDLCLTKNTTWEEVAQASGYDLYVTAPYGDRYYWAAVENREDRSDEDFEEPQEAWKDCCITNNLVQS